MQLLKVDLTDLTPLQPCIFLAIEIPSHIQQGGVDKSQLTDATVKDKISAIKEQRETVCAVLSMFERQPERLTDMDAFWHQVNFWYNTYAWVLP